MSDTDQTLADPGADCEPAPATGPERPHEAALGELVSSDGAWWWDGQQWRARDHLPNEPASAAGIVATTTPGPTAGLERYHPAPSRSAVPAPELGLAGLLHRLTGGALRLAPSQRELVRLQLRQHIRTPILGPPARIAFAGAKGGVGKTTLALAVAATLGRLRNDRIIVYETNHVGTFETRLALDHDRSLEDLVGLIQSASRVVDIPLPVVDLYTTQVPDDRFTVLAAPGNPAAARLLGAPEHRQVLRLVYRLFDIVVADLDPALLHDSTAYWLGQVADQVVVVSPTAFSGARLADATLSHLERRRGREWVQQRTAVVVNAVRRSARSETREIEHHFRNRIHRVHRVPWDPYLEQGGLFLWDEILGATRDAYLELTASLASGFALGQSAAGEAADQG